MHFNGKELLWAKARMNCECVELEVQPFFSLQCKVLGIF